jgi:hypothetical protein
MERRISTVYYLNTCTHTHTHTEVTFNLSRVMERRISTDNSKQQRLKKYMICFVVVDTTVL